MKSPPTRRSRFCANLALRSHNLDDFRPATRSQALTIGSRSFAKICAPKSVQLFPAPTAKRPRPSVMASAGRSCSRRPRARGGAPGKAILTDNCVSDIVKSHYCCARLATRRQQAFQSSSSPKNGSWSARSRFASFGAQSIFADGTTFCQGISLCLSRNCLGQSREISTTTQYTLEHGESCSISAMLQVRCFSTYSSGRHRPINSCAPFNTCGSMPSVSILIRRHAGSLSESSVTSGTFSLFADSRESDTAPKIGIYVWRRQRRKVRSRRSIFQPLFGGSGHCRGH